MPNTVSFRYQVMLIDTGSLIISIINKPFRQAMLFISIILINNTIMRKNRDSHY